MDNSGTALSLFGVCIRATGFVLQVLVPAGFPPQSLTRSHIFLNQFFEISPKFLPIHGKAHFLHRKIYAEKSFFAPLHSKLKAVQIQPEKNSPFNYLWNTFFINAYIILRNQFLTITFSEEWSKKYSNIILLFSFSLRSFPSRKAHFFHRKT